MRSIEGNKKGKPNSGLRWGAVKKRTQRVLLKRKKWHLIKRSTEQVKVNQMKNFTGLGANALRQERAGVFEEWKEAGELKRTKWDRNDTR